MLRAKILDSNNKETNGGVFGTEALLQEWYDFNVDYFPKPHTLVVTSLVDENLDKQRDIETEEAFDLGLKVRKLIRKLNRRKLKLGIWDSTKFNALMSSPIASQIERGLTNGSLGTVSYLLTNMSEYYSDLEIAPIVDKLNAHETKWSWLI